jgi:hypothetical protein
VPASDLCAAARGGEPRGELVLLAVHAMVTQEVFDESAGERSQRLRGLVARVAVEDPDWTLRFVGWLRTGALLRSAALVTAAEAVRARLQAGHAGGNRALVRAALARADEPGEFLAYWVGRYGRRLPQPVKRGVADAAVALYGERSLVTYDGRTRAFRFGDVLELVHPAPRDARQGVLFRYALDRRHGRGRSVPDLLPLLAARARLLALPVPQRRAVLAGAYGDPAAVLASTAMTWESVAGWLQGPLDAAAWEALVPTLDYTALLRNLRKLDEAGVADDVASAVASRIADPDEVARSRRLPLQLLAAYRAAPSLRWCRALEKALQASLVSVPALPGRTLVLVDRSGSMSTRLSARDTVTPADGAAVFGAALALRAAAADLVEFGTTSRVVPVERGASLLRVAGSMGTLGGADTAHAVREHYRGHDRVVIVTAEQARAGPGGADPTAAVPQRVPVYTFDLAGHRFGHAPSGGTGAAANRHAFGGLTDQAFAAIEVLERDRGSGWPF